MQMLDRRMKGFAALLLIAIAYAPVFAQSAPQDARPLAVALSNDGIELPASVEPGFYFVELDNRTSGSAAPNDLAVDRLKEGATLEDAAQGYRRVNEAMMGMGGNPGEAVADLTELLVAVGGYSQPPMAFELTPGDYMVSVSREDGSLDYVALTVPEAAGSGESPVPDVTVDMLDFAFSIPDEVAAGQQTWEIRNVGEQVHHMIMIRLNDGKTVDDLMAFLETEEGEPPGEEVGFTSILSPGVSNFVDYDLQPGEYFVICFLPDYETGQPHFMLGMTDAFSVTGN